MANRHEAADESRRLDRRNLLATIGAAGTAGFAGCGGLGATEPSGSAGSDPDDGGLFPLSVRLETGGTDERIRMVELIAESLQQTGYFETEVETYEWNAYLDRVINPEYQGNGYLPAIGLSGTFNPHSFCNVIHNSANVGACCNLTGIADPELDELLDSARYGIEVVEDPQFRAETYDEIWRTLADERYTSFTHFGVETAVSNADVHGFGMWPFQEGLFGYALYAPQDEQVVWINRDRRAGDSDLADLVEGGTLTGAVSTNPNSFDPPHSSDTTSTMLQNLLFEGLVVNDAEGNVYPWLAERYELRDVRNVDRTAYEEYMRTAGTTAEGAVDVDEQVIVRHPEDDPATADEVRVLLPEDAREAAADGTYGMRFRYELREGVEFHDGSELTAEDVVASYEYYENSATAPQTFDSVLAAVAVDEYVVDVYAQVPDAEAERELPGIYVLSSDQIAAVEKGGIDPREGVTPIGTGPYEFGEFVDEEYLEVARFDDYWVGSRGVEAAFEWFDGPDAFPDGPVVDGVEVEVVPDDATRAGALRSGEIDLTYDVASGTLADFDDAEGFLVHVVEAGGYDYLQYPVNVEPWDDPRLREAVNHLIPRQRIVDNVLNGWAEPAWTPIPRIARGAGTTDYDALEEAIRPLNEYDVDRAEELLEEMAAEYGESS
ncbi:peptide/nickel transport system substrate-binding protein [Halorubrum cibi]|uniref:Peptide/nickel transport system substrate-binding protein n=2 Tax=Halorubrum cibi TaxID=413815 RepID=A0A521AWI4_9EURY|nr:ABC transporter substrate-binding protein [Halorubrum cibi]SMO39212.1 peptide/nickel transport system substrate-binding protein [Halorubrum cibi]